MEKVCFSLKGLLEERAEAFQSFDRNSFSIEVEDRMINADKIGFEKMIDNLLMNAMKYSQKHEPVSLTLKDKVLYIQDRGIGMDETELLKVYERYYQADSKKDGQGIGLALVKAYCDEEKIDIDIKSEKNVGTVISLNLTERFNC